MKRKILAAASAVMGLTAVWAYETTVTGDGGRKDKNVVPVLLSNGRLTVLLDEKLSVPKVYSYGRSSYSNAVVWAGRRLTAPVYDLYPHGRFEPVVKVSGRELGIPATWSQTLDTRRAETRIVRKYADGITVSGCAFVAEADNVIALRLEVNGAPSPEIELAFSPPEGERLFPVMTEEGGVRRMRMKSFGRTVTETGMDLLCVRPSPSVAEFYLVYADTQESETGSLEARLAAAAARIRAAGWDALRARHQASWAAFYAAGNVVVPDERYARLREMAQYQMRCSLTEWSIPVGMTPGMWEGKLFAFDEMYAVQGLLSSGHFAEARRATDFRFATLRDAHARNGAWGWKNHRNGHSFGARWLWQGMEDNVIEGARPGYWLDHIFHMAAIARSAYLQYRFTDDLAYLREKAYPVMMECARFFRWQWVYDDPRDRNAFIGKCTDLERLGPGRERACMTTVGVIHTFRIAADCAQRLGVDAAEASELRKLADRLERGLPIQDGVFIAHPGATENSMGTLAGYFPFPIFPRGHEVMMRTVEKFLSEGRSVGNMYREGKRVCPWYAATMSVAAGMTGERKTPGLWLAETLASAGVWGEFWEINEPGTAERRPWFMTAAANTLYAFNRMFVTDADGELRVAFTVPEAWRDYAFDLPAEGGIRVACTVRDGRVASLKLTARDPACGKGLRLRFRAEMVADGVPGNVIVRSKEVREGEALIVCDLQ